MKILVTKNTVCGGERVKSGSVIDASDAEARFLMAIGKAKKAPVARKAKAKSSDGVQ